MPCCCSPHWCCSALPLQVLALSYLDSRPMELVNVDPATGNVTVLATLEVRAHANRSVAGNIAVLATLEVRAGACARCAGRQAVAGTKEPLGRFPACSLA